MTNVISVRVPAPIRAALRAHAEQLRRSPADVLRALISYSFESVDSLAALADYPDSLDDKCDARISHRGIERLEHFRRSAKR